MTPADKEVVELFVARLRRQIAAEAAEIGGRRRRRSAWLTVPVPTVAGNTVSGECAALQRDDFASFAARSFRELNPRTPFAAN